MAKPRKRGGNWYYRYTDENGKEVERVGCSNKAETEKIAAKVKARVAQVKAGLIDTKSERHAAEARKPLSVHLADFRGYLLSKGGSPKHATNKANRAERLLLELAGCKSLGDITITSVQGAVSLLAGDGKSIQTQNHYLDAAKMFTSWLVRDGRISDNPIAYLSRRSPLSDLRRVRRSLSVEECERLVDAMATAQDILDVPATDRLALYLVAIGTGFRAAEIRSLTPERFQLEGPTPSITVKAGYTKNRKEAAQPINPNLAGGLRPWLATKAPGKPVFPYPLGWFAPMLRSDLKLAGIPVQTEAGLVDFHALRSTYVSLLVSSGATVKEAQTLARHSTPALTFGVYAKVQASEVNAAVKRLPDHSKKSEGE